MKSPENLQAPHDFHKKYHSSHFLHRQSPNYVTNDSKLPKNFMLTHIHDHERNHDTVISVAVRPTDIRNQMIRPLS